MLSMLRQVKTENGLVKGLPGNNARITSFKGIPYAAPPTGKNRFKAPQPAKSWKGVLNAYEFAPIAIQDTPGIGEDLYDKEWHVDPEIPMSEDCLYLNVWTPAHKENEKLPVLFVVHGGAFQWGYPNEMEFNAENVAKRGIVVVTISYRLGIFGFLAHPELTVENPNAPTNFGLLDQQAALMWVVRNIAAFGGDPTKITITGQSAGGGSVLNQLVNKKNKPYINGAFIMSGIIRDPFKDDDVIKPISLEKAEDKGMNLFKNLGISSIDEARQMDAKELSDKYSSYRNRYGMLNPKGFIAPCIDGKFLTDDPYEMMLAGDYARVPIVSGNTKDEFLVNLSDENVIKKLNDAGITKEDMDDANVWQNGLTFVEHAVKGAFSQNEDVPCYYYRFCPDIPGDNSGCFHSVDLWFFYETLAASWRPFTGRHYDLARQMCDYMCNFVKTGNPNGMGSDMAMLPQWNPYTVAHSDEMEFTSFGAKATTNKTAFNDKLTRILGGKKQAFNPYLPSWEYVPDGEPYVFGDRVYVYGSHDYSKGHAFCLGDYVCWSAPVDALGDWRYEGVIYKRTDDPLNVRNNMCLYAPDVTIGPDGRYYLYYVLDKVSVVSVAVCDTPCGKFEFYGYVHYKDGTKLGDSIGDEPQFDPGVMTIGDTTYLFTGFCGQGDKSRHGAMRTILDKDMLTIKKSPKIIAPGCMYSKGTPFENHAFFEAPSIRERNGKFYFIYSSQVMHELCYAMSDSIDGEFEYGGVITSNCDIGIDSYKPANMPTAYGANNHGSIVEINGEWYIFYHRQTNNSWYSRQVCAEKISFTEDGHIIQAELTSCGLNNGPLKGKGEYMAYIVCNMFNEKQSPYIGDSTQPKVVQDGKDGDRNLGYIDNITNNTTLGFKYFDLKGLKKIKFKTRGYSNGHFAIKTSIDGPVVGTSSNIEFSTIWEECVAEVNIPDGVSALYFTFVGSGECSLKSFELI